MSKLVENDDIIVVTPSNCEFCLCDTKKLYCCPKCSKFYCSLRCYKNAKHSSCSEKFYKDQIELKVHGHVSEEPKVDDRLKTATSFEDYMKKMKIEDDKKTQEEKNPQIEVEEDEELLFDSDEEPEYLSKIVDKSLDDYEKANMEEINLKLMKAGIGSLLGDDDEQMGKLFNLLTDEEKKTFSKMAEAMHYDETGISKSCFKKK
uniref:HIT-type domain-containing protein n=1 Tax=Panagrolaimus sp. JU765 TaxID=591449 RepID=A0AC34R1V5_9BILA